MRGRECRNVSSMNVSSIGSHRYEIMNFQHVQPGVYDYINIGSWHEGLLSLDEEMIRMNRSDMVRSVCSEPCSKGEIKVAENRPATLPSRPILLSLCLCRSSPVVLSGSCRRAFFWFLKSLCSVGDPERGGELLLDLHCL